MIVGLIRWYTMRESELGISINTRYHIGQLYLDYAYLCDIAVWRVIFILEIDILSTLTNKKHWRCIESDYRQDLLHTDYGYKYV